MDSPVFSLNAHADYACRHSGACCTAGWSIPVEPRLQARIGADWLIPGGDKACPQYDPPSGLCKLQREGGETLLPDSCHHFPRRALIDERGTFVVLSHYCPTAAALLVHGTAPLEVVANPRAFPASRRYDGLDARGEWPPLLRPDVLFDSPSFALWERYLVEDVGRSGETVDRTLARVADTGERLRCWSIDRGPLVDWTRQVLERETRVATTASGRYAAFTGLDAFLGAARAVPSDLDAPVVPDDIDAVDAELVAPTWDRLAPLAVRYLGAKAFASWTAYQSRGVRTQIAELFMTAAVLRVECARACRERRRMLDADAVVDAVRASDFLLVHLADRDMLMAWLGKAENDVRSPSSPHP